MAASLSLLGWTVRMAKILHPGGIATAAALVLAVLGVLSGTLLGTAPAAAQQGAQQPSLQVYTVRAVPVDATAKNAVEAREQALVQGQMQALRQLLQRLTPPSVHGDLPMPQASEVQNMVLGVAIEDEKTSAVRYLAKLDVTFMPGAVRAMLDRSGVPYSDTRSRPVVVLPLYYPTPESQPVLWEEPNPWRQVWQSRAHGVMVPLEVPLGELADVTAVDAQAAARMDEQALAAIAQRYGAQATAVIRAVHQPGRDGAAGALQVALTSDGMLVRDFTTTAPVGAGETLEQAMERVVSQVEQQYEQAWKDQALAFAAGSGHMTALVMLNGGLQQWLEVRRTLDRTPPIRSWTLQALSRDRAQLALDHAGTPEQLATLLGHQGLSMEQDVGFWVIRPPGVPAVAPASAQQPAYQTPGVDQGTVVVQ